jgi:hypothetical protein
MREAVFQQKRRHLAHAILRNECFARLMDDPNLIRGETEISARVTLCVEASFRSQERDNQQLGLMLWVKGQKAEGIITTEVLDWLSALDKCEVFEATSNWPGQDQILSWINAAGAAASDITANPADKKAWESFWKHAIHLADLVDETAQNHKRRPHLLNIKW